MDNRVSSICAFIATHECQALELDVRLCGISKSDWDQTTALHDCFEDTLKSVVNFVSERAFVLSCGVHGTEEYAPTTISRSVSSSTNSNDIDKEEQIESSMTKEDDIMVSNKTSIVDGGRNPDLTMLLQKKGKTFLARTFLPKTQRVCVLNDYSFSFGRATYNVTAHASKTVIPLFMIWKVDCVQKRSKELYDITIHLRHDHPKDDIYKKSIFSFIMNANESDAQRRNEEFLRRLESLCGEKQSRVPPFPDILDELRKEYDDSKSTYIPYRSRTYSLEKIDLHSNHAPI